MGMYDAGRVKCEKHGLFNDYLSEQSLNNLTCIEEKEGELNMKLGKFIERFIAKNTLIRLWKALDADNPYGEKKALCILMEWEAQEIELLKDIKVIHITDIVCIRDAEAVNIVLDTEQTKEEVEKAVKEYRRQREERRKNYVLS